MKPLIGCVLVLFSSLGCSLLPATEPRELVCSNTDLLPQPERDRVAALCDTGESLERICAQYPKACQ